MTLIILVALIIQAAPGSPGLASAADRNWSQECTDRSLDQDCRQNNKQGPLQKAAMDEWCFGPKGTGPSILTDITKGV